MAQSPTRTKLQLSQATFWVMHLLLAVTVPFLVSPFPTSVPRITPSKERLAPNSCQAVFQGEPNRESS